MPKPASTKPLPEYLRRPDTPTPKAAPLPPEVVDANVIIRQSAAYDVWGKRSTSPTRKVGVRNPNRTGGGSLPAEDAPEEAWLGWVAESIRDVVRTTYCVKCGSPAGLPCRNGVYVFDALPNGVHPNRNMRPAYQAWVHRDRAMVYEYHQLMEML